MMNWKREKRQKSTSFLVSASMWKIITFTKTEIIEKARSLYPLFCLLSIIFNAVKVIFIKQFNFFFYYCCSSTVVSIFFLPLPLPHPTPPPTLNYPPHWLYPCVLYTCSLMTLLLFCSLIPCYCQFVLYFNVSGYILLACLFCWLGSTYR